MAIFEPNIYMREIKELYSEELALLKQIRSYGREHSQGKMERVEKVKLLLLFRIYSNLYSSLLLTVQVLKTGKISFFQLPIGLLLRCCFTDCLFALYIQRAGKERAYEELDLRTIEYANSMLDDTPKPVYSVFRNPYTAPLPPASVTPFSLPPFPSRRRQTPAPRRTWHR